MLTVQTRRIPLIMSVVPDKELVLEFGQLEAKVSELLEKMTRLKQENRSLRGAEWKQDFHRGRL